MVCYPFARYQTTQFNKDTHHMEKYIVKLTKEERINLLSLIKKGKSAARKLEHARVLLEIDEHQDGILRKTDKDIASIFHISEKTVYRIKQRFVNEGLESALERKPHANKRPLKIQGDEEARLIALCCSSAPEGQCRWTLSLLTEKLISLNILDEVSRSTVGRSLQKNELKPWQKIEWCIPEANAEFVCKMEDVLDVYKRPYDEKRPVICMDESNKQLTKETRAPIPSAPGQPERYVTEYERNGTSNIFLACEPLAGKRQIKITDHRKKTDFAEFIQELVDVHYPAADKIVLVMDNLNTHNGSSLYEKFEPSEAKRILDKLEIHYTPKHGSWLNIAEIELSHLSRQCLNRRIPDQETFIHETNAWCKRRNESNATVDWQFTTDDARIKLKRLYPILMK